MQHLEDIAGDVEGSRDPTYHLLRLEYRLSKKAYEKVRDLPAYRDGVVVEKVRNMQSISWTLWDRSG